MNRSPRLPIAGLGGRLRPGSGLTLIVTLLLLLAAGVAGASSGIGHFGQSLYLMAIEMPAHPIVYQTALGEELFTALTAEVSSPQAPFTFARLNRAQRAFLAGSIAPDACDKKYHFGLGFPIHKKYPQAALNLVRDLSRTPGLADPLAARAFFYGWSFHYVTDLVVHPALNQSNQYREGRDFAKHPPQHAILEGLLDRICIYYFFLRHPEKGISPSRIIAEQKLSGLITFLFKTVPDSWCQASAFSKEHLKACGKALAGLLDTDLRHLRDGLDEARATLAEGRERVAFLRSALFDAQLKAFVARGVPEAEILAGRARLGDFFPTDPAVRSVIGEGILWWKEVLRNTPRGFTLAPTGEGFATNLDYGTPTPETPPSRQQKALIVDCFRKVMADIAR